MEDKLLFKLSNILKRYLIFSFTILSVILVSYFLVGVGLFKDYTFLTIDSRSQYIEFYKLFRENLFSNPEVLIYNQGLGLGNETFGLFNYYLASPLNLLLFLFPVKNLEEGLLFLILLKLVLGGIFFDKYLSKYKLGNAFTTMLSLSYVLSGFFIFNLINPIWLDLCYMLPLMLMGLDKLIETGSKKWFVLSLTLMIFINYYIGFILCLFSFIYITYKYFTDKFRLKVFLDYFISAGMIVATSLTTLYTTYLSVSASKGFGGDNVFKEFFKQILTPSELTNKLFFVTMEPTSISDGNPNVWISSFVLAFLVILFLDKRVPLRLKLINTSYIALLYLIFSTKGLNLLFHGMSSPIWFLYRNSFMMPTLIILMVANYLKEYKPNKFEGIKFFKVYYYLFPIVVNISLFIFNKGYILINIPLIVFIIGIFCLVDLVYIKDSSIYKVIAYLISLFQIAYFVFFTVLVPYTLIGLENKQNRLEYEKEAIAIENVLKSSGLQKGDRIFKNTYKTPATMENLNREYNEFFGFSSNLNRASLDFLNQIAVSSTSNNFDVYTRNIFMDNFFANKYYVLTKEIPQKEESFGKIKMDFQDFTYYDRFYVNHWSDLGSEKPIGETQYNRIYENPYAFERFYTTVSKENASDKFKKNRKDNLNTLFQTTFNTEESPFSYKKAPYKVTLDNIEKDKDKYSVKENNKESEIIFHFNSEKDFHGQLYNGIYFDKVDNGSLEIEASFNKNNFELARNVNNKFVVTSNTVFFEKGENTLVFKIKKSKYNKDAKLFYNPEILHTDSKLVDSYFKEYKESHNVQIVSDNLRNIKVSFDDNEDKMLRSTIPYDKGWKANLNGKEVPVKNIDSFIAIDIEGIDSGEVEFKYSIDYIFSVISLQILAILFTIFKLDNLYFKKTPQNEK